MKLTKIWPVWLLAINILFQFPFFNPDLTLIPLLKIKNFSLGQMIIIVGVVGFLELLLGYIAWGGFSQMLVGHFEQDINFARKIAGELKADGYVDRFRVYFARKHSRFMDPQSRIRRWLRRGGYSLFFLLGINPLPGTRLPADIICGSLHWSKGFVALAIGNFIKTAGYVWGWDLSLQ